MTMPLMKPTPRQTIKYEALYGARMHGFTSFFSEPQMCTPATGFFVIHAVFFWISDTLIAKTPSSTFGDKSKLEII